MLAETAGSSHFLLGIYCYSSPATRTRWDTWKARRHYIVLWYRIFYDITLYNYVILYVITIIISSIISSSITSTTTSITTTGSIAPSPPPHPHPTAAQGRLSSFRFAEFQFEGLESLKRCLCSLRPALRKLTSPRGCAHFSRLSFLRTGRIAPLLLLPLLPLLVIGCFIIPYMFTIYYYYH